MIIKKFKADTEKDAILLAKEELGSEAVVMNIKTVTPKGFFKFLRKPVVEVTAAVDENIDYGSKATVKPNINPNVKQPANFEAKPEAPKPPYSDVSAIEKKLNALQGLLEKQMSESKKEKPLTEEKNLDNKQEVHENLSDSFDTKPDNSAIIEKKDNKNGLNSCMQLVYKQLLNNDVDEKYVNELTGELEASIKKDAQVDRILAAVYQKLVLKLGQPSLIETTPETTKYAFFLGPTGVGKTTTIAKIASLFKIKEKKNVGLLTADTYRVAAVEQLRTYANILEIPLNVVYSASEMKELNEVLSRHELVLVDTAGRSDKNTDQIKELKRLINTVPEENREVYLVLSATTKYRDLVRITKAYEDITKYKLIFTKIDETDTIGNVYNILMLTKASLSYVTFGQNVPDDIGPADTQFIAKELLS